MIYVRSYDMSAQSKVSPCPAPLPLNSPQGFIQDVPLRGGDRGGRGSNCRVAFFRDLRKCRMMLAHLINKGPDCLLNWSSFQNLRRLGGE